MWPSTSCGTWRGSQFGIWLATAVIRPKLNDARPSRKRIRSSAKRRGLRIRRRRKRTILVACANVPTVAPYGSWSSPISVDLVANEGGVAYGYLIAGDNGVYWLESRPQEAGRQALVFRPHGGKPVDVVPAAFNVRTRVHEYGGGAWFLDGETVYCSSFADSRLYRIDSVGAQPRPITPEPPAPHAWRYADGRVFADGRLIVCVRETHGDGEPVNELVVLPSDGSHEPRVIQSGRDFYAAPRPSPDG